MVRGGGDGVASLGDHARARDVADDFRARQVAADAGLRALADLDLDGRAGLEVFLVHAETPRRNLDDRVGTVFVKILVQAALAGVVVCPERLRRAGEALVRVVADGAVAHGREHDGNLEPELRRKIVREDLAVRPAAQLRRFLAEERARLHRLAQRVDGRVRHLRGVEQHPVPVDRVFFRVAHGGEQHAARLRLAVDLGDGGAVPLAVELERIGILYDLQRAGGAKRDAAVAVHAFGFVASHLAGFRVEGMHLVGALPLAHAAGDAALRVADHVVLRNDVIDRHYARTPLFSPTMTGSPPRGDQSRSRLGWMVRMAHSSLAT